MKFPKSTCVRTTAMARLRIAALFFPVLCVLIFSSQRLYAQNAALTGLITDPSGAVIQHAQVTLTDERTSAVWKATTNDRGLYSVPNIAPGKYTLDVNALGFKHYKQPDINVDPAQAVAFDAHLQVGGASQSVMVTAGTDYAGGQVATNAGLGMLGNRDVMDTPFNVIGYTSQTVENQQAQSLAEVLNNNSSVRSIFAQGSYTDELYIRGFLVFNQDVSLNGLFGVLPFQLINPDFAERIEIQQGPSALLNGMSPGGSVGGTINVVPKRAADIPIFRFTPSYGMNSEFGGHLDAGRRFGADKEWGVRFNASIRGGNTAVKQQYERVGDTVAGLDYRGKRLKVGLDLGYLNNYATGQTEPVYLDTGIQLPKAPKATLNFFAPWSLWNGYDGFAALRAEYSLPFKATIFGALGGDNNKYSDLATQPDIISSTGDITNTPYQFPARNNTRSEEGGIQGTFTTGPIHHSYSIIGAGLTRETGSNLISASTTISTNIYQPSWGDAPTWSGDLNARPRTSNFSYPGVAGADTLSALNNRILLTLGLRRQYVNTHSYNRTTQAVTASYSEAATTPAFAIVGKPLKNLSLYGNYIEGLQPGSTAPSSAKNADQVFPPFRSKQYEVGAKLDLGRITGTLSLYQIEQPNGITNPDTLIYSVSGRQRNRGIELNTFGELTKDLRVLGGLTLMKGIQLNTGDDTIEGRNAPGIPNVQFNYGLEWDTFFAHGLTLTAQAIDTSHQYADAANTQPMPAWGIFNPGARYSFKRSGEKQIVVKGDVLNALGDNYWAGTSAAYGIVRGNPRTFRLSATFDF